MTRNFNDLDPREFENFVANLYTKLGYDTTLTSHSKDEGVDIIAKKGGKTFAIQVKKINHPVGSPVIQRLYGSMGHIAANGGICISSCGFSTDARKFAESKDIELLDIQDLIQLAGDEKIELVDVTRLQKPEELSFSVSVGKEGKKLIKFKCPVCGEIISFKLYTKGEEEYRIHCPNCGQVIKFETERLRKWFCDYCYRSFTTQEAAENHEAQCPNRNITKIVSK